MLCTAIIQEEQKLTEIEEDARPSNGKGHLPSFASIEIKLSIAPCSVMSSPNKN